MCVPVWCEAEHLLIKGFPSSCSDAGCEQRQRLVLSLEGTHTAAGLMAVDVAACSTGLGLFPLNKRKNL